MKRMSRHIIEGTINCVSGLHVGGADDQLEIGGLDLPVIKHPDTKEPYIPGSSLKGRMRSELEHKLGKYSGKSANEPCGCCLADCPICRVFGPHKFDPRHPPGAGHPGPTRLLVRDAQAIGALALELKTESGNDRATGQAGNPRQLERVAAGAKFHLRLMLQVFDTDDKFKYAGKTGKDALLAVVCEALGYVQSSGIGGGISRGSGEVRIDGMTLDDKPWPCN
ncbi:MAG: type III-A CRISPR-associated RAMP protein Csm3 [Acidobacteriia bacterium]|nr:type III-A CRISPR-associated RAMP protein Csm3 [Terriglobia bacterium]